MIIALILIFFSGGLNAPNIDLTDPAALAEFKQKVSTIIEEPVRAKKVTDSIYHLNTMPVRNRATEDTAEQEIKKFKAIAGNYNAPKAEILTAFKELEDSLENVNQNTIDSREIIRRNTTKKEWGKLLQALKKK